MQKCFDCGAIIAKEEKYSLFFQGNDVELTPRFGNIKHCNVCNQKNVSKTLKKHGVLFTYFLKIEGKKLKIDWKKYFNSPLFKSALRGNGHEVWNIYYDLTDLLQAIGIVSQEIKGNFLLSNNAYSFRAFGGNTLYFINEDDVFNFSVFMGTESPTKEPLDLEAYRISKKITASDILKYYKKIK